jgi:hypothetical protein
MTTGKYILLILLCTTLSCQAADFWSKGHSAVLKGNYSEALKVFSEGVKESHPASLDYLGWLHLEGLGTPKNPWIAYGYFRQAHLLGEDDAGRNLGNMYYSGLGVKQSLEKAKMWWRKSAKLNSDQAAMSLATALFTFGNDSANKQEAIDIWEKLSDKGNRQALVAYQFARATLQTNSSNILTLLDEEPSLKKSKSPTFRIARMQAGGGLDYLLPVKFAMQAKNFCALASTSMLLQHAGADVCQFALAKHCGEKVWGNGAHWLSMIEAASSHNAILMVGSFPNDVDGYQKGIDFLRNSLSKGKPVVIDILQDGENSAHSMLLIGYSSRENVFIFRDPALAFPGFRIIHNNRFQKLWKSVGYVPNNLTAKRPYLAIKSS